MHISQLKESKFLRKEDCGKGILVTIDHIEQMNVAGAGQPEEMKWCLVFREDVKPIVTNSTNRQSIADITGSEETDDWHGHQIVLYLDPTVMNRGKVTGGIRVRAPKRPPVAPPTGLVGRAAPAPGLPAPVIRSAPAPAPAPEGYGPEGEDDVPF